MWLLWLSLCFLPVGTRWSGSTSASFKIRDNQENIKCRVPKERLCVEQRDDKDDKEEGNYPVTVNSNHLDLFRKGAEPEIVAKHLCKVWTEPLVQAGCVTQPLTVTAPWRLERKHQRLKQSENWKWATEEEERLLPVIHSSVQHKEQKSLSPGHWTSAENIDLPAGDLLHFTSKASQLWMCAEETWCHNSQYQNSQFNTFPGIISAINLEWNN